MNDHEWTATDAHGASLCMRCGVSRASVAAGFECPYTRLAQPEPAAISKRAIHWDAAKQIPLARDMTVRERFAMAAMQAVLSNANVSNAAESLWVARAAVKHADALLAALGVQRDA